MNEERTGKGLRQVKNVVYCFDVLQYIINVVYWFFYDWQYMINVVYCFGVLQYMINDIKGVIRSRKSEDKQQNSQMKKEKRANIDLQSIHMKLTIE
jgi:hypothetical protein